MKAKNFALFVTGSIFLVAFAKDGTLSKLARSAENFAQVGVGGFSRVARKV